MVIIKEVPRNGHKSRSCTNNVVKVCLLTYLTFELLLNVIIINRINNQPLLAKIGTIKVVSHIERIGERKYLIDW